MFFKLLLYEMEKQKIIIMLSSNAQIILKASTSMDISLSSVPWRWETWTRSVKSF